MAHFSDQRPIDSPLESLSTEPRSTLPHNRFSETVDAFIITASRFFSWLWVATLLVVLLNVFSRFFLNAGSIALEELSWHLFGAGMMLTMAYSVVTDEHVRVDVLFEKFSLRVQAWVELVLVVFLLFPVLYIVTENLFEYAYRSWERGEGAASPSGLSNRFIIKTIIPVGMTMVIVALLSRISRLCTLLMNWPRKIA
tara:strand:- start:2544 stop:3134 length:591 start_codon:yes stop_codon:yes gene_type:complete